MVLVRLAGAEVTEGFCTKLAVLSSLCMDEDRSPAGQQIPDTAKFDVGRRVRTQDCRIMRVPSLPGEDRSDAALPHFLDCVQDAELVVDHHIMTRRIYALDVGKHLFFSASISSLWMKTSTRPPKACHRTERQILRGWKTASPSDRITTCPQRLTL
jgi:hypothetical protein